MKGLGNISMFLVALFVMFMVVLGMTNFYVDLSGKYGINMDYYHGEANNLTSFKVINSTLDKVEAIKNVTTTMTQNPTIITATWGFIVSAFGAFEIVWQSVAVFTSMIGDVVSILGLPSYVGLAFEAILIVVIVFTILSAALKWSV
jgi:hypothetical protein